MKNNDSPLSKFTINYTSIATHNNIHLVCPALKNNSILSRTLLNDFRKDIAFIGIMCDNVNLHQETGTLWPLFPITIFPAFKSFNVLNDDLNEIHSISRKIFKDILIANENHIKKKKILFVIDDADWLHNNNHLILAEIVKNEKKSITYLEEIEFYY
jgi:hypothetical protein